MMRKEWFDFVRKTRKKLQRSSKNKDVTHQKAMSEASKLWPKEKEKIQRRLKREKHKREAVTQGMSLESKISDNQ